jgi:hypothetical protein
VARIRTGDYDVPVGDLDSAMAQVVNDSDAPEADIDDYVLGIADADLDAIVKGYLDCQLWAGIDTDREDTKLDANYCRHDINPDYVDRVRKELLEVVTAHPLAVRMYLNARERTGYDRNELFGHDFYLTRERHGAGFWDRGLGEVGDYLTKIAHSYGCAELLFDNGNGILS